jgi:ribose transport system permease protein
MENSAGWNSAGWNIHWRDWLRRIMPVVALMIVIAIFTLAGWITQRGRFFTMDNFCLVLCSSATVAVAALGMMLVIAVGGIDLSAGAILGLCTAMFAVALKYCGTWESATWLTLAPYLCLVLTLLVGMLCGALNGFLINTFRLTPFIVTLAAMAAYLGLALILSAEKTVSPPRELIPDWLRYWIHRQVFGWIIPGVPRIPTGIVLEILLALALAFILRYTLFGRHILAVGANEQAAKLCGIRVGWLRIGVYALAGAFFALAGVYQFSNVANYTPNTGQGKELDIIAAVVIGGGSLKGGKASVLGTLVGSLLMTVIRSGCTQLSIDSPYEQIIIGVIIIVAVLFDRSTGRGE